MMSHNESSLVISQLTIVQVSAANFGSISWWSEFDAAAKINFPVKTLITKLKNNQF